MIQLRHSSLLAAVLLLALSGCGGGTNPGSTLPETGFAQVEFQGEEGEDILGFGGDVSVADNVPEDQDAPLNSADATVLEGTSLRLDGESFTPQSFIGGFDQSPGASEVRSAIAGEQRVAGYMRLFAKRTAGSPLLDLDFAGGGVRLEVPVEGVIEGATLDVAALQADGSHAVDPGEDASLTLDELGSTADVRAANSGQEAVFTVDRTGIYVLLAQGNE